MKQTAQKWLAFLMALCLGLGLMGGALSETQAASAQPTDFEALSPLMNLVAGAAMVAHDEPQPIAGADGTLDNAFITAFFSLGLTADPSLSIAQAILDDPAAQAEYLGKVFAAQMPELAAIPEQTPINGVIGFQAITVNTAAETGGIQIVGEIYWSPKPMPELTAQEYDQVQWLDKAVYSFQRDDSAMNGFRLAGFSVGSELNMETAIQNYFDQILVEYVNTALGFSVQYPSVFTDDLLVEDDSGVAAALPDGSASFFARRTQNADGTDLRRYVQVIADGIPGAKMELHEDFQYATIAYTDAEGRTIFGVFIVTDKYVYQTELSYLTTLNSQYQVYTSYLENTFMVEEVSVG